MYIGAAVDDYFSGALHPQCIQILKNTLPCLLFKKPAQIALVKVYRRCNLAQGELLSVMILETQQHSLDIRMTALV